MKYIPAEKLKAEIERQQRKLTVLSLIGSVDMRRDSALKNGVYDYVLDVITSLQQKQQEANLNEHQIADIIQSLFPTDQFIESESLLLDREEAIKFARHFYELGMARKEE